MAATINGKRAKIWMHAVIAGTPKGMETDHINGNGLDNRRRNLRIVSCRENHQNLHIVKTSKYPGVSWYKRGRKWRVFFNRNKTRLYLGSYSDEETAGIIYAMACNAEKMGAFS